MYNVTSVKEATDVVEALQAIAEAIPPANPVPDVESTDNGKVLKATYSEGTGSYDWEDESGGVPDYSQASQGSVLNKQYNGELGWDRPEDLLHEGSLLPEITGNDDGKVLTAVYNDKSGSYAEWQTPSGGGGGIGSTTFTVNGSDFTQHGSSYEVVFDSNGDYQGDMTKVISSRIYYSPMCSIPCSIIYVDKTGWLAQVTADDYTYISGTSGITLKIFAQNYFIILTND